MSKLAQLLHNMYQEGSIRDKVPQKRKLQHGLHINLTCHSRGATLIISRDNQYPSAQEWITCLKNFPYFVGQIPFVKIIDSDRRYALKGELPSRRTVAEQMTFI